MESPPETDQVSARDRIPVLTEPASMTPAAANDSDLDALTEPVLDEIAPAQHAPSPPPAKTISPRAKRRPTKSLSADKL